MASLNISFDRHTGNVEIQLVENGITQESQRFWRELSSAALLANEQSSLGRARITIPWVGMLRFVRNMRNLAHVYGIAVNYDEESYQRLSRWVADINSVTNTSIISSQLGATADFHSLDEALESNHWDFSRRRLTGEQNRDLSKLLQMQNGANFSVPGAGKTTVALALHQITATRMAGLRLLVVSPKNAFSAWDDVIEDCLVAGSPRFTRLTGGQDAIARLLEGNPRYSIISYGQVSRIADLIISYLIEHPVHLILDESHRIKAGTSGSISTEILKLSPFAFRRDILSGTPRPQSQSDLEPQFEFLFPASDVQERIRTSSDLRSVIRPLYVRTKYSELGVPQPEPDPVTEEMSDGQRLLYSFLRDDVLRQHASPNSRAIPNPGSVMRLLQAAIDPQTAAEAIIKSGGNGNQTLLQICHSVLTEDIGPRLKSAIRIAQSTLNLGAKVVIWAPFTKTIDRLSTELSEHGSRVLYGATPTGESDEDGTRENIIKEFHQSDRCNVLIANPAAGGEGISLHKVCHHAIYVGRTYNATNYLQSRDRINRLGMPEGTRTRLTIIECRAPARIGSIDLSVRRRLDLKIRAMGDALDDDDLRDISFESDSADENLEDDFNLDDLKDLLDELRGSQQAP